MQIYSPLRCEIALKLPRGGVGQLLLGSNDSRINPHMRAKFGSCQTVVLEERGVQIDRQRDTAALYSRLLMQIFRIMCQHSKLHLSETNDYFLGQVNIL